MDDGVSGKAAHSLQSSHHLHIGILLIVEDVGLEHSNGARDQQYDDTQGNENLHHSE
jgi:hypothetical protein